MFTFWQHLGGTWPKLGQCLKSHLGGIVFESYAAVLGTSLPRGLDSHCFDVCERPSWREVNVLSAQFGSSCLECPAQNRPLAIKNRTLARRNKALRPRAYSFQPRVRVPIQPHRQRGLAYFTKVMYIYIYIWCVFVPHPSEWGC